jgi:hypothetical protein
MTAVAAAADVPAGDKNAGQAAEQHFAATTPERVKESVLAWVNAQVTDPALRQQAADLWTDMAELSAADALSRSVETFALVDPTVKAFLDQCKLVGGPLTAPEFPLVDGAQDELVVNTLRLHFARHLTQRRMYDEALAQFEQLDPARVIDPATCLFYKAVCEHELLMKDEGLKTISLLTSHTEDVPVRYASVAKLMQYELEQLRKDTLDEVARMMADVERRLDLGRAGHKVQKREAEVIAALDYLIEKLEQCGACSGACPCNGLGGNKNQSSSPANESSVKGNTAPGEVDKKNVAQKAGWGMLPDKEQAAAKQYIDKNFPPHYRKQMEEYFKKIAELKR